MRNLFLIPIFLLIAFACREKTAPADHVLSEAQMVQYLIDLHIEEARINDLSIRRDSSEKLFEEVEAKLYEKHGIDDSLYQISYEYYLKDVEGLDKIYSAVVDSLSLRERLSATEEEKLEEIEEEKE